MTSVEKILIPYTAFNIEERRPPAFVVHARDEASVFPYNELIGAIWLQNEHQIFIAHHFFNLYLHGKNLERLVDAFGSYLVKRVDVFEAERHEPPSAEATVITHIDDHYEKDRPVVASRRRRAG